MAFASSIIRSIHWQHLPDVRLTAAQRRGLGPRRRLTMPSPNPEPPPVTMAT